MTSPNVSDFQRTSSAAEQRLIAAVEEYWSGIRAGLNVSRAEFLQCHADIAAELAECLEGMDYVQAAAPGISQGESSRSPVGETIQAGTPLGDFLLLRELGRGGMGIVYEAEQLSLRRRVALKVLPFAGVLDPRQLQRFKNEGMAAASLDHPNIVDVYGVGCERGVHYYAMRLIDGQTLAELITQMRHSRAMPEHPPAESLSDLVTQRQMNAQRVGGASAEGGCASPPPRVSAPAVETVPEPVAQHTIRQASFPPIYFRSIAEVGMRVAEALEHAHWEGIVHRDIKPSNLMLDSRGKVWITDFGLAHIESGASLTVSGDMLGTLRYMSPEQAQAKHGLVDHRSDIYSLGATLYELLTLLPVVGGSDRQEVLNRIILDDPRSLRSINRFIPADLETIVLKALAKDPADRYSTAQEMADDLRRFLEDKVIFARRPTYRQRLSKLARRHRSLVGAFIIGLILAIIGLTISIWLIRGEREEAIRQRDEAERQRNAVLERERRLSNYACATDLALAWQAWRNADLDQVHRLLARREPSANPSDYDFIRHYLTRLCRHDSRITFRGHKGNVYHVAFSPSGEILATAGQDGTVHLWKTSTGRIVATLRGHTSEINCVAFAPNGRTLATASDDQTVRLWDTRGKEQGLFKGFCWSPARVLFSPDGRTLAVGEVSNTRDGGATTLWDVSRQQQKTSLNYFPLAFTPDGQTLATSCPDCTVRLFNLGSNREPLILKGHAQHVGTGAFSPNGQILATACGGGTVITWSAATGKRLDTLPWNAGSVRTVTFSPDSRLLAWSTDRGTVRIWHVRSGTQQLVLPQPAPVWSVAFAPDGRKLAVAGAGTVELWDLGRASARKTLAERHNDIPSLAFTPDSRFLAAADGNDALLWDVRSGKQRTIRPGTDEEAIQGLCYSPDRRYLAVAIKSGPICLLDPTTGREYLRLEGHGREAASYLTFSPDGRLLASNASDGSLKVWDVNTGAEYLHLEKVPNHLSCFQGVAFTPDGKILGIQSGRTVRYLELTTQRTWDLRESHRGMIRCLAFSPDGSLLATGGNDRWIELRDRETGQERQTLHGHQGRINSLAFSPDGQTLASCGDDGQLKLWDVATGQEVVTLVKGHLRIARAVFSPDGHSLAAVGSLFSPGELYLWHVGPQKWQKAKDGKPSPPPSATE